MKITKYEHACFVLEDKGERLIVDPGAFTQLPDNLDTIVGIVYTHGHFDHYTPEQHAKLTTNNPKAVVYATKEIAPEISGSIVPETGKEYSVGAYKIEFYGKHHADKNPPTPNFGVIVNDTVAYPGDSEDEAGKHIKVLLAPANGPWMRITETMALIDKTNAKLVIPTHDALLSDAGNKVADTYLKSAVDKTGGKYIRLGIGESLEV